MAKWWNGKLHIPSKMSFLRGKAAPEPWPDTLTMAPGVEYLILDVLGVEAIEVETHQWGLSRRIDLRLYRAGEMAAYADMSYGYARNIRRYQTSGNAEYAMNASKLRVLVPGFDRHVRLPCHCAPKERRETVWDAVQHLNDVHHPKRYAEKSRLGWDKDRIADWLEGLNVDLTVDETIDPRAVMQEEIRRLTQLPPPEGCTCGACRNRYSLPSWTT